MGTQPLSSRTYLRWAITRALTRTILRRLADGRLLRTALGNLTGASRFQTLGGKKLMAAQGPKCGNTNSWSHHVQWYGLIIPQKADEAKSSEDVKYFLSTIHASQQAMMVATNRGFRTVYFESWLPEPDTQ